MSTFEVVALTSATSIATLILSRVRCIVKTCHQDGEKCVSGCTDKPLRKDEHEIDVSQFDLNGREVIILTSKD